MSGQPTRAVQPSDTAAGNHLHPVIDTWRRWAKFVRRPTLPDRADLSPGAGLKTVLSLFALDLAIMAILFSALGAAMALGFELPQHVLGEFDLTALLVLGIVVGAPLGEEVLFRGWLSGRAGHVLASLFFGAAAALLVATRGGQPGSDPWSFGGLALLGAAAVSLFVLRGRPPLGWFQRHFAWFFWASALIFAAVHLTNFAAAGPALLPMVLPQFALALLLGYLRVTHGLWSAVLLHILHNATFVAAMLVGSAAG